ncbi:MAG: hypothetical protein IT521_14415 [Burkholderiales bacterium]|nr:hypothetical protein [Burkholderiales bacterium]
MKLRIAIPVMCAAMAALAASSVADAQGRSGGGGGRPGMSGGGGYGGGGRPGMSGGGRSYSGGTVRGTHWNGGGRPGWGAAGRPGWGAPGHPGWGRPGWGAPGRPGWGRPGWGWGSGWGPAWRAGWWGGGWGWNAGWGGWWGPSVGFAIGAPVVWNNWSTPVVVNSTPLTWGDPVTVAESQVPVVVAQAAPAAPATTLWYYCTSPAGYFPYVQNCDEAWIPVAPQSVMGN